MPIHYTTYSSPLGSITASAQDDALCGLWFDGQKYCPHGTKAWVFSPDYPVLAQLRTWLDAYFKGENPVFPGRLSPNGSAFRQEVWQILLQIPYGQTTTYGTIAQQLARAHGKQRMSAQAVGGAVGHNPISLVIPCHRVVGSTGSLTGYAGGIEKKEALLRLEGALSQNRRDGQMERGCFPSWESGGSGRGSYPAYPSYPALLPCTLPVIDASQNSVR
ncbi:MAG: methylated-DNA--[protein]-cysteine S-methyltransferase [Coriobacteriales bacterium]|jgi:methylated-DNA-[protein]-cysteine S-methyltransferase|nr:methylated-DNA--[protein]-cysteine S-methyltransferase [Coriobacteriales bacterium]